MIQICKSCGAVNAEAVERCCFCEEPFAQGAVKPEASAARAASGAPPSRSLSVQGKFAAQHRNLRDEVAGRVEAYRERRRQLLPGDPQTDSLFRKPIEEDTEQEDFAAQEEPDEPEDVPRRGPLLPSQSEEPAMYRSLPLPRPQAHGVERVEIAISQPELDFGLAESRPRAVLETDEAVIPVASLPDRRRAGLLDAIFLLLACGAIFGVFRAFGGRLVAGKLDFAVIAAVLALLYAQYFALFTVFGGETPGMMSRKLRVVAFDGSDPTPRQLRWRSFGYLVSGGTALLGFLWALWDEDHLTWHDRISQTYITDAPPTDSPEQ